MKERETGEKRTQESMIKEVMPLSANYMLHNKDKEFCRKRCSLLSVSEICDENIRTTCSLAQCAPILDMFGALCLETEIVYICYYF